MFADHILSEDIDNVPIPETPTLEQSEEEKTEAEQDTTQPVEEENEVAIAFRFIEKLRKIRYAYESQLIELKKTIIELRKNKEAIFSKKLEGDGTKIIPAWENIAKCSNTGEGGEFESYAVLKPFGRGIMTDDYKFSLYDNVAHEEVIHVINTKKQIIGLLFPQYAAKVNSFEEIFELGLNNEETLIENQVIDKNLPTLFNYFHAGIITAQLESIRSVCDDQIRLLSAFTMDPNALDPKSEKCIIKESVYRKALLGALLGEEELPDVPSVETPPEETEQPDQDEDQDSTDTNNSQETEALPQPNSIEENPFKRPLFNKMLWQLEVASLLYKIVLKNATDALAIINLYSPAPIQLVQVSGEIAPKQPETEETPNTETETPEEVPTAPEAPEEEPSTDDNSEQQAQEDESESMNTDITEEDDSDKEF